MSVLFRIIKKVIIYYNLRPFLAIFRDPRFLLKTPGPDPTSPVRFLIPFLAFLLICLNGTTFLAIIYHFQSVLLLFQALGSVLLL